jgi:Ca-activated chloride channel homolog
MKSGYYQFVLIALAAVMMAGCGPSPATSVAPAAVVSSGGPGRIKDGWIKADDTKGITLEENLLRKNIYMVFDCSTSMEGEKVQVAKRAINQFASSIPEGTGLGLTIFDGAGPSERLPLGLGPDNRKQFNLLVTRAVVGNGTPLDDAIRIGYEALRKQAKAQLGYGEYHLVIITDGEANLGHDPTKVVNELLADSPVVVHTIGFYIGPTHSLNQPGRTIYKDAQSPKDLEEGLGEVLAESDKF